MYYILIFIAGLIVGIGIGCLIFRMPFGGTLLITDDEDGTYLSAELSQPPSFIRKKKCVNMKIRDLHNGYYEGNQ